MSELTPTIKPTVKQWQAWQRLMATDKVTEFIVYGGAAGGGKSWLGCEWLLTNCFHYPGTRYFIAREELKDIRESTLISFYKVLSHHGIKSQGLFKYNGQDHFFQFFNGSRIDLVELKAYPSDPLFERFGSMEFTSGWIEEAGEADGLAAQMLGSRTGRMLNDKYGLIGKVFMTCNPKKNFLYYDYYKPFKEGKLPVNKAFIQAFVDDNNYGESGYKHKLQNLTGVARERLLLGNWEYDDDPSALIEYEKILDCFKNKYLAEQEGDKYITCDVARFGDDKTIIGVWNGARVKLYSYKGQSVTETADKIQRLQMLYNIGASEVIVDEDGVGGGVVDILGCHGFVNNARPLNNPITHEEENYANLKSQCYFRLAERINKNGLYIDCQDVDVIADIIQELEQVKQYQMDKDKKRQVLPKDKVKETIGRSPDYADTLMMREWFELGPQRSWVAF